MSEKITKLKYKKNGIIETIYPVTHVDAIVGNMMLSKVVNVVASTAQTNLWGNPIRYKVPQTSSGNTSIVMLINAENTSSAGSEKYLGIIEMNILSTGSNQTNGSNLNWLVVHGFEKENFHLRHLKSADEILLWVKPTIGNLTITILSETTNGVATNDAILVDKPALTTVTSTTIVGDKLSDSQFLGLNNTISGSKVTGKLADGVEAFTQSVGDNSDKVATTKYVDQSTPTIKTLHSKSLLGSGNITLTASEVGARPAGNVPWTEVSSKPTWIGSSKPTYTASEVKARPDTWMPTAAQVGAEPAFTKNTAFNKNFGTSAGTVTEGNDSRLSDARASNDVLSWAKIGNSDTIPASKLPALAITDTFEVATQSAMTNLTAQKGDIAIRTDLNKTFILAAEPASTVGNWKELKTPTDAVLSVAGLTGVITSSNLKTSLSLNNVQNKSSATIRSEITSDNVTSALGFTPYNSTNPNGYQKNSDITRAEIEAKLTGAVTTITSNNLTTNRALISNGSGKVAVSSVTSTELGYLDGVTSGIQGQLNNRATTSYVNGKIYLKSNTDNRSVNTEPNDYNAKFEIKGLKSNSTLGITGQGSYSALLGIRGWTDSSGGNSHEFALTGNGEIYHRHGATTSWNAWNVLAKQSWVASNTRSSSWTPTWAQVTGKPSWIGSSKPSYTASEVGAAAASHIHSMDEIEGLPEVLHKSFVWRDTGNRVSVPTQSGIDSLSSPYNSISPSHIFATESEAENHEPSSGSIYGLVTGFKWVSSNSTEYNAASIKLTDSVNFSGVVESDVNRLVIPCYDLWDYGRGSVVIRINQSGVGYSYWKLVQEDATFQGDPKVYEPILEDAIRLTWGQVSGKPSWIGSSKPTYNLDEISDGSTYKRFTATEKNKLSGIETGAQKNNTITKAEIEAKLTGNITSHTHSQYLTSFTETDPTVPSHVKSITSGNISSWNNKFDTPTGTTSQYVRGNGSLATFPSIPSIPSVMTTTEGNTGTATTQRTINAANLKSIILNHSPAGSRPASDVSAWAKKSSLAIGDIPTGTTGSTVALGNHTHGTATTSAAGFMSGADKTKLNGIEAGAQVNRTIATTAQAQAGTNNTTVMTPLRVKDAITASAITGTWKEVYSGPSNLISKTSYQILSLNETAIYYNRPMMMEIKYGSNGSNYSNQIVTFNLGDNTTFTESKTFPRHVSITDFDGRYSKTISVKVYVNTQEATNSLRVGVLRTLVGDFTGSSGTLTWTTQVSDTLSVYIGKIWVMV